MNICREAGVVDISSVDITNITVNPVPSGEEWRVPLLRDLLLSKQCDSNSFLNMEEVDIIMNFVCCQ